jgi:hypothetical protein
MYNVFFLGGGGDCGVLHSFYMTKPSYSLAFNKPNNVLPCSQSFWYSRSLRLLAPVILVHGMITYIQEILEIGRRVSMGRRLNGNTLAAVNGHLRPLRESVAYERDVGVIS